MEILQTNKSRKDNFLTDKCIEKLFEDRMKNEAPDYKWYVGLDDDNLKD